jgi:hypothetical protein
MAKRPPKPRGKLTPIDGYVWCDRHGVVHENCLDPYDYGPPEDKGEDMRCQLDDHVKVYARQFS